MTDKTVRPAHRRFVLTVVALFAVVTAAPALAQAEAETDEVLHVEIDTPRPLAEAIRELSIRHGLVVTYEDPRWSHESEVEDITDQFPAAKKAWAEGSLTRRILRPRFDQLAFSYHLGEVGLERDGGRGLVERLLRETSNGYEVREVERTLHVVPTDLLNASAERVSHTSPLDLSIEFPPERRTIRSTLASILEAVNEVSDTPVEFGYVFIGSFDRHEVVLGSNGRTARELLVEAMRLDHLKTSWFMYYDPGLRKYFLSVYPVRFRPSEAESGGGR